MGKFWTEVFLFFARGPGGEAVADATYALRTRGEDAWDAAWALAHRITRVVRWSLAIAVPLALTAAGLVIADTNRYLVFGVAAGATAFLVLVVAIWYAGSILAMEVGETTLRHMRHRMAHEAQALVTTARRGLTKVLAISTLPLGAGLWALAADPKDQWLAGAILLVALVLVVFAVIGPQGGGRWVLLFLAMAAIIAATLVGLLGNQDSYLHQAQERHAVAVALEREQRAATTTTAATATTAQPSPGPVVWRFEESYLLEPGQRIHVDVRGAATAAGIPASVRLSWEAEPRCTDYELRLEFIQSGNVFIVTPDQGWVNAGHEVADFWLSTLSSACTVRVHAELS